MVLEKLNNLFRKNKKTKKRAIVKKPLRKKTAKNRPRAHKAKALTAKTVVKKEKLIAGVVHYFSKIKVAILKMKSDLKINDKIHIKGFTTDFTQIVASMQINHNPVEIVKKGQEIGILVKNKVRHKDKVYKIE